MRHHTFTNILKWSNKKHFYPVIKCTASLLVMAAIGNLSVFLCVWYTGICSAKEQNHYKTDWSQYCLSRNLIFFILIQEVSILRKHIKFNTFSCFYVTWKGEKMHFIVLKKNKKELQMSVHNLKTAYIYNCRFSKCWLFSRKRTLS